MTGEALEDTLSELERRGGRAWASSSTRVGLAISLSGSRPTGSVISAVISYSGPTLADGTPLRRDVDGNLTPEPPGYDALKETGVRVELIRRGWNVDGAELRKEWIIRGGADRLSLRDEIRDVLATIGPDDNLSLTYRAPGDDAGFAQVGCLVTPASAVVASLLGVVVVFIVEGLFNPGAGVIGFIAGSLTGVFVSSPAVSVAVRVRRLRPNAEDVAILAGICVAAVLALIVTLLIGLMSAQGRGIGWPI